MPKANSGLGVNQPSTTIGVAPPARNKKSASQCFFAVRTRSKNGQRFRQVKVQIALTVGCSFSWVDCNTGVTVFSAVRRAEVQRLRTPQVQAQLHLLLLVSTTSFPHVCERLGVLSSSTECIDTLTSSPASFLIADAAPEEVSHKRIVSTGVVAEERSSVSIQGCQRPASRSTSVAASCVYCPLPSRTGCLKTRTPGWRSFERLIVGREIIAATFQSIA